MAFAAALSLLFAVGALAKGGHPPLPPEEEALSGATTAYNAALTRFNGYVLEHGSMMDETAKCLEAEKESARRAVSKAAALVRKKPSQAPAAAPALEPVSTPAAPAVPPAGKGAILAGGVVIGTALLGVGALGWYRRRPRILPCPGCKKRLRVLARGRKTRCPSCKTVFES